MRVTNYEKIRLSNKLRKGDKCLLCMLWVKGNLFEKPWSWWMSGCPWASWYISAHQQYCTPVNHRNRHKIFIHNCILEISRLIFLLLDMGSYTCSSFAKIKLTDKPEWRLSTKRKPKLIFQHVKTQLKPKARWPRNLKSALQTNGFQKLL